MKYINFFIGLTLLFLVNIFIVQGVSAENDDFGLWTGVDFEKKITKDLSARIGGEFRTKDNVNSVDRYTVDMGISYKLLPFIKAYFDYKYIYKKLSSEITKKDNYVPSYWSPRHRLSFSLKGDYEWNRLEFSLRERYQYTYEEALSVEKYDGSTGERKNNEEINSEQESVLRSRFKVDWNIKKCNFTPYASYEFFNGLDDWGLDKTRLKVGTKYKIDKHSSLNFYYAYQKWIDDDDIKGSILGVSYGFKF